MYTPEGHHYFYCKIYLKLLGSHYTYYFCIINAFPQQLDALEGLYTYAVRPGEMAYIALPNIVWWSLVETRLDDLFTHPCQLMHYTI